VYYFGPGQGGSEEANIARWQSQFSGPKGGAVEPVVERYEVAGVPVTRVEPRGSYARGVGVGPGGTARPDQTLLAAIVETGRGNVFVQIHGPSELVGREREGFDRFLRGLHRQGSPP
jgi:hypothetical protein